MDRTFNGGAFVIGDEQWATATSSADSGSAATIRCNAVHALAVALSEDGDWRAVLDENRDVGRDAYNHAGQPG